MKKNIKLILGIETSCDETAVSLLGIKGKKINVFFNLVYSQIKDHQFFGGVVPEIAARKHLEILPTLFAKIKQKTAIDFRDINYIAVTNGPGLITSLMVGVDTAKTISLIYNKPLIPVNHLIGHILSTFLPAGNKETIKPIALPALALLVSGGHTELVLVQNTKSYKKIGGTVDDAVGESFDKVAKMLKLGYPGGPLREKLSQSGNPKYFNLPRPMSQQKENLNYSYSGLKTAVRILLLNKKVNFRLKADISAAFQEAAIDSLFIKLEKAISLYKPKSILLCGGVAQNKLLRKKFVSLAKVLNIDFSMAPLKCTQDNALMIAFAGWILKERAVLPNELGKIISQPNLTYD